ncbi:hypothetical protein [Clostridium tyrobutyricum]|uniref:hypothetical protein n=1 Tax=Clostridium tyrobutyricum TaxID=1519 RepID=UPI001C38EF09|nr:hypothetical protein [Clostridium tyrobutyricum]MBV4417058.1 hypothetical protein [Clostridium tyrobutyricum]
MEILSKSEAERLSNSVMKYIKKARYFRIRVDLPGIAPELERESVIDALKKGFTVLSASKVNGKGSHRRIYVNLRVKN